MRVLFVDLETAPCLGWAWGIWEQNIIDLKKSWYILAFAYKWQGERKVHAKAITDYKRFKKDKEDDKELVKDLWRLFNEADVIIAHNGDKFDIRKSNARFVKHSLSPPRPYKSVDTLKLARSQFGFLSNRLNDLGAYLNIGRKLPHTGFDLWKRCMLGERKAIKKMKAYNARDVWLLEKVYDRLKPWAKSHPDLAEGDGCPTCKSTHVHRRGRVRQTRKYQFNCVDCGHWWTAVVTGESDVAGNRRRSGM